MANGVGSAAGRSKRDQMPKQIRLNAFDMNCVGHQSPGLWTHPRDRADRYNTLDYWVELAKRGSLGWLRGERGHCTMARVPTIAEEDAKRPNRERECLVAERTRIVNRMKATLARLGIRGFKPTLRKAADRLATLHTPEGMPLPPNVLAELQRDMARLGFVVSQVREIEEAR